MHHTQCPKRGLLLFLLSRVALVAAVTLSISLLLPPGPAHAARAGDASDRWSSLFHLVGPKQHYLALGNSLAFGFQPDGDFIHGYVNDLFQILQNEGTTDLTNLGCLGETSTTFIHGGICPYLPPFSSQLEAAVAFLKINAGRVSPVTLDIGANDVLPDLHFDPQTQTCTVDLAKFQMDLQTLDNNLTHTILPQLHGALTFKGHSTGDLVMMNYYDALQNLCPNTVPFIQILNQHLAIDVRGFGSIVDVFSAFGGANTPNPNICTYTWMCTPPLQFSASIHPTNLGYSVIAYTFAIAILTDCRYGCVTKLSVGNDGQ